jgi:hypothetical protein
MNLFKYSLVFLFIKHSWELPGNNIQGFMSNLKINLIKSNLKINLIKSNLKINLIKIELNLMT